MALQNLQQWSHQLVGTTVQVCAQPVANHMSALTSHESQAVANAVEIRQNTYSTGRYSAKAALDCLGISLTHYPDGLIRQSDGAVKWPEGSLGSISHTDDWAVAAVAKTGGQYSSIGIDLEQIDRVEEGVLRIIATEDERSYLQANPALRWGRVGLFSIKESLYKCLRPIYGEFIKFEDVQISDLHQEQKPASHTNATGDNVLIYQPTIELIEPKLAACCNQQRIEARVAILKSHVLSFVGYSQ